MAEYHLTYFNMRGRAEAIRILFALADVPYVDNRVDFKDFLQLKSTLPFGQLPILKLNNGFVLSQSQTIGRFLAKKFNLYGKDEFESARIDEICDAIVDHELAFWRACSGTNSEDDTKKTRIENYLTVITPKYFSRFNRILENNRSKYLVGQSVTFADIRLANHIEFFSEMTQMNLIENYSHLQGYASSIMDIPRIKEWMVKRPVSCVRKEEKEYDAGVR